MIVTVGGVVSGALEPNVVHDLARSCSSVLAGASYVHWHVRALYSPHEPAWFWNDFTAGPDSRYVIGSRLSYLWSRPHECAVSCATVQQMSLMFVGSSFANENEIEFGM